ncbi:MAG: response regulator transcription factor [Kiritimatiellae bacterium]|nr:response regulator transcription factor [Kiritimatiellia bacterium]
MAIRVLLADDHKMIRDGLRSLIGQEEGMEVIAQAEDGKSTVRIARKLCPDVVVMDIGMPDLNGIEATRQIAGAKKNIKVIGLSMHSDRRYVSQMLKAGASGYLHKDDAFEELAEAIRTVMKGKTYLSPDIAKTLVDEYRRTAEPKDDGTAFSALTDREREVLQQIAEGKTTKETAAHLGVSVKTIETHRLKIMDKLDIHSIAELTKYAVREGLTELES